MDEARRSHVAAWRPMRAALAVPLALLALSPVPVSAHDNHAHHAKEAAAAASKGYTRAEARYTIPDVELLDVNGAKVSLRHQLDSGMPVMVNFIFTSCAAICPVMSATMSEVQGALRAQQSPVRIVSISIDPEHDTPARLKEYATRHGAGPEWHLLTGSTQSVLAVARAFGAWRGDKMNHDPSTYLRGADDRPWLRLDGFATPAELLREYGNVVRAAAVSSAR